MTTKSLTTLAIASAFAVTLAASTAKAVIVYGVDASSPVSIPGLSSFTTDGSEMGGLRVRAVFTGGTDETRIWAPTIPGAGGVSGTGWSLAQSGDTFTDPWTFTMTPSLGQLLRLTLDGGAALTVFDRTEPSTGTVGSSEGRDFEFFGGTCGSCDAQVTFREPTSIGADPAAGDLWQVVDILFATPDGDPTGPRVTWQFRQDTDNDIRRDIPAPASLPLLIGALGIVGGLRFRNARIAG